MKSLKADITAALDKVPEAQDKLQMLQEYDTPGDPEAAEQLLAQIRTKYYDVMR